MKKHTLTKRTAHRLSLALLAATCLTNPAHADGVTAANGATAVHNAPNGVPIVDIATANQQGLSHNRYTDYNVDSRGLILNNANSDQISRDSQLAGKVMFNPNLNKEATVILNEVVSTKRSTLAGYTEVVGGSADVVVANPYGITCNGCGFINSPNVTISTGTPDVVGGTYRGMTVKQGDILVTGDGLDGRAQDYVALLGRSIKVDGTVAANDLAVIAGVNSYDASTHVATATTGGTGTTPTYAIDSTVLGGIYAGRIRLQATEAGVGVRALGDVAATANDFTIDASGKIQLSSNISAERDVTIVTSATDADAIKTTDASITAKRYLDLVANDGGVQLQGGSLVAQNGLGIQAQTLSDTKTSTAGADNNKRYATHNLNIITSGATNISETSYGAGDSLTIDADSINLGTNGSTLYSDGSMALTTANNMELTKAALRANTDLTLTSGGTLSTLAGTSQGIKSDTGNIALTSTGAFTNAGSISADNGTLTTRTGNFNNTGTLHSKGAMNIADKTAGATESFDNSGTILSEGALTVQSSALGNTGNIQGNGATITTGTVTNSGVLQSATALALNALGITNTNKIISTGDMTIRNTSATKYTLDNSGRIEAGGKLDIKGKDGTKNIDVTNSAANAVLLGDTVDMNVTTLTLADDSGLTSKGDLTLLADTLSMGGSGSYVVASSTSGRNGTGTITIANAFTNNGAVHSGYDLNLSADSISNTGTGGISALHNMTANARTGNFINDGALYAFSLLTANSGSKLQNTATGTMNSDSGISITADNFTNNNDVIAKGDITVTAREFHNDITGPDNRKYVYPVDHNHPATTFKPNDTHSIDAIYDQANINEVNTSNNYEGITGGYDSTHYYEGTFTASQIYDGGKPTHSPRIIGGTSGTGTFTLKNFDTATNVGGVISSHDVVLSGNSGSTFTNDSLALQKQNWAFSYNNYFDFGGDSGGDVSYRSFEKHIVSTVNKSTDAADNIGAGIFAANITGSGFTLSNIQGSTAKTGTVQSTNANGASGTGVSGLTFGGVTVSLPTNPNGYFVASQDPNSKYLIETNPRFGSSNAFGSDYMARQFGVDPDNIQRRLGDANYETSSVRDQLVAQTGTNSLNRNESEDQQMQRLMDNGVSQGKALGLAFGQKPTDAQLAGLKQDMVWMVETEVKGQKVLAPVVYLSAATKSMFEAGGAQIAGNNVNLNLAGVNNNGGTIAGTNTLNIASTGDINNISGTITGGNVNLSTQGSINNITSAQTGGTAGNTSTAIGQTATISSTGNLSLDARKDIINKGANMAAGGDASLNAGGNVTFDTIQDKSSSTTASNVGNESLGLGASSSRTETNVTNIKSGLTTGGNLDVHSGNDITFAGTDVKAGGDASLDARSNINVLSRDDSHSVSTSTSTTALTEHHSNTSSTATTTNIGSNLETAGSLTTRSGSDTNIIGSNVNAGGNVDIKSTGDLNVLAGHNTTTTNSSSTDTGVGVGGGVYGTQTTDDSRYQSHNVGSTITSGGNTSLDASGSNLTIQGSSVNAGGNVDVKGDSVDIIEGRDIDDSHHSSSTTTFLSTSNTGSQNTDAQANAAAGTNDGKASASAGASVGAGSNSGAGLALSDTTITTTDTHSSHAVGSSITSGGNTNIDSTGRVTIRGSSVDAGGDVGLTGNDINITAAQDVDTTTTTTENARVGFFADSNNNASAGADAEANADRGGATATGHGNGGGAGAGFNAGDASIDASAKADAKATSDNTLDLVQHKKTSTTGTDIVNQGSSIKSGGNMKVTAKDKLNVHGSDIDGGGDVDLSAKDMSFTAADDSHTITTTTTNTRAGLYAGAGANASADASGEAHAKGLSAEGSANAEANADAGTGLYGTNTTSSHASGTTTARTSTITSGGNMTRTATGGITDVGTQIESGGDFTQTAKTWDSKAAKDTSFDTSNSSTNTAKFGLYGEAGADAHADGNATAGIGSKPVHTENESDAEAGASTGLKAQYDYSQSGSSENSSNAVVSNIKSGGNFKSTTTDKTSLEGTNIDAGGDAELSAKSLDYSAAKNTSSSSSTDTSAHGEARVGLDAEKAVTGTLSGDYANGSESSSSSESVVGGMKAGKNLTVTTTDDARFEGTNLEAGDDAKISAGGDLKFDAAHDTSTSTSTKTSASAAISASKAKGGGKKDIAKGVEAEGSYETTTETSDDAVTGSIKSGGKMDVSAGKSATFEGTNLESGGDASVTAGDNVNFNAAKSTSTSQTVKAGGKLQASKGSGGSQSGIELEGGYGHEKDVTSAASGIKSGGNMKIDAGKDVNLEGTNIEAKDKTTLKAGKDVNFKAAEDTHEALDVEASATFGKVKANAGATEGSLGPSTGRYSKKKAETTEAEGKKSTGLDASVTYGQSNTKKVGSVNSGSLDVQSGGDTTLEGTNLNTKGDTSIDAKGNVNMNAAKSSSVDGSFGGSVGNEDGALINDAGVGGEDVRQGSRVNTGGNLNINSGGKTSMTGTKANVGGTADIKADGGIDKSSAVSGGGQIGLTRAGASIDVQQTDIQAGGGVTEH